MAHRSLILVKYNDQREENRHYVRIAEVLDALGVRAPKIYFHDEAEGLIWMEDLGERDLWSYREEPWPVRRGYYQSALEEVWRLHDRGWEGLSRFPFTLQIEFNAALYRWEQRYFFDHCLGRYFENLHDPAKVERLAALPVWEQIAEKLAGVAARAGAPGLPVAEHPHPRRTRAPDRFPGAAARAGALRSRLAAVRSLRAPSAGGTRGVDRFLPRPGPPQRPGRDARASSTKSTACAPCNA